MATNFKRNNYIIILPVCRSRRWRVARWPSSTTASSTRCRWPRTVRRYSRPSMPSWTSAVPCWPRRKRASSPCRRWSAHWLVMRITVKWWRRQTKRIKAVRWWCATSPTCTSRACCDDGKTSRRPRPYDYRRSLSKMIRLVEMIHPFE